MIYPTILLAIIASVYSAPAGCPGGKGGDECSTYDFSCV